MGRVVRSIVIVLGACLSISAWTSDVSISTFEMETSPGYVDLRWEVTSPDSIVSLEVWVAEKRHRRVVVPAKRAVSLPADASNWRLYTHSLRDIEVSLVARLNDGVSVSSEVKSIVVAHKSVDMFELDGRRIFVYRPPQFDPTKVYPVVYAQDGQNLFSTASGSRNEWRIDETLDRLIGNGSIRPMIVVGIESGARRGLEYVPLALGHPKGEGEVYARWMVDTLLPAVESRYPVSTERKNRAVMGYSYGGPITFFLAFKYAKTFGVLAAISPAMDFGGEQFLRQQLNRRGAPRPKIYIDAGEREYYTILHDVPFDFALYSRRLVSLFIDNGYVYGEDVFYYEDPGVATHEDSFVAQRVATPLLLFGGYPSEPDKLELSVSQVNTPNERDRHSMHVNAVLHRQNGLKFTQMNLCVYALSSSAEVFINHQGALFGTPEKATVVDVSCDGVKQRLSIPFSH